jgi:hypothetical protein
LLAEADILSLENESEGKNPHLKTFFNRSGLDFNGDLKEKKNLVKSKKISVSDRRTKEK